jgi:hypothetical protein
MDTKRGGHLYQLRMGSGRTAGALVCELVQAAWGVLSKTKRSEGLDPHQWPGLYQLFRNVLQDRLVHYRGCGELEECRMGLASSADRSPYPAEEWAEGTPAFTLEAGRDLGRLSRLMAAMAVRKFRVVPRPERGELVPRTAAVIEDVFKRRSFESGACAGCSARRGFRERRLWPEEAAKGACHDENVKNIGGD